MTAKPDLPACHDRVAGRIILHAMSSDSAVSDPPPFLNRSEGLKKTHTLQEVIGGNRYPVLRRSLSSLRGRSRYCPATYTVSRDGGRWRRVLGGTHCGTKGQKVGKREDLGSRCYESSL